MTFRYQFRRATKAVAAANNPVLLSAEPGVETDTGAWKMGDGVTAWTSLPYQPRQTVLNVRDYGAVGDGTTDDTAALTSALTAATALGGSVAKAATVLIPPGEYRITSNVSVPANVTIRGAGIQSTVIAPVGAITGLTMNNYSRLEQLRVRGTTGPGVPVVAGSVGVNSAAASHHWVLDHVAIAYLEIGVVHTNCFITSLDTCVINACTTGLQISGANNNAVTVTGGEIAACVTGVDITSGSSGVGLRFIACCIEGNTGWGMSLAGAQYLISVLGSYFEANTSGHITVTGVTHALTVRNSSFVGDSPFCLKMTAGVESIIDGNSFASTNGAPVAISCGASVARTNIGTNYYLAPLTFVAATDYLGTDLRLFDASGIMAKQITLTLGSLILNGSGFPEASVTAPVGSIYQRTNGQLYYKETGTGNTGWLVTQFIKTATTAQLAAIGDAINTANKVIGRRVYNTTTNKPVYATGTAAGSVWNDAVGVLAHTPV
jgi:hypothetical protein